MTVYAKVLVITYITVAMNILLITSMSTLSFSLLLSLSYENDMTKIQLSNYRYYKNINILERVR